MNDVDNVEVLIERLRVGDFENLEKIPDVEIAYLLPDLSDAQQDRLLISLDKERRAEILSEADDSVQKSIIDRFETAQVAEMIGELAPDDGADILEALPDKESREVLNQMDSASSKEMEELLHHDPESAGGLMTPDCILLNAEYTAEEAIHAARDALDAEMVAYVYIVDSQGRLEGVVSLRHLLMANPSALLSDIIVRDVVSVHLDDHKSSVAELAMKYHYVALPVVDEENRFKGIVTVDDIMDVMEEEASEDIFRLAGTESGSPTLESVMSRVKKRLPYLLVTLVGGGMAALILRQFKNEIEALVMLSYFIPVVIGMAGNVGVQCSTVVVRGLATGEIIPSRFSKVFVHEVKVGLSLSFVFCLLSSLIVYFIEPSIAITVGIGMASGIIMASTVGTAVPLFCEKMDFDPALAAGPFVTTTNDMLGVLVYLQVAKWLI